MAKKFYAYFLKDSQEKGICTTWDQCKSKVYGTTNAMYKGFKTEAMALEWLDNPSYSTSSKPNSNKLSQPPGIVQGVYWDAGTGGGKGVEVRVTDEHGTPLLFLVTPLELLTAEGNYLIGKSVTNNYGELAGLYAALKIAKQTGVSLLLGDSKLVIEYWSKGRINRKNITDIKTINLVEKVTALRTQFEIDGGEIRYISGDYNVADLGYHKKK